MFKWFRDVQVAKIVILMFYLQTLPDLSNIFVLEDPEQVQFKQVKIDYKHGQVCMQNGGLVK